MELIDKIKYIIKNQSKIWDDDILYSKKYLQNLSPRRVHSIYTDLCNDLMINEDIYSKNNMSKLRKYLREFREIPKVTPLDLRKRIKEDLGEHPTMFDLRRIKKDNNRIATDGLDEVFNDVDEFDKAVDNQDFKPVKRELTPEEEDEVDTFNRGKGMQDLEYDGGMTDEYKKRMEEFMGHMKDELMGGAKLRKDNEEKHNRFHVKLKEDKDCGCSEKTKIKESNKNKKSKIVRIDELSPESQDKKQMKNKKKVMEKFAVQEDFRLKSKTPITEENLSNVLPAKYKQDGAVIRLTDGVNTFKFKWEGNISEGYPVILNSKNANVFTEELSKASRLMNYQAKDYIDTKTNIEGNANDVFLRMLKESKDKNTK